MEVYGRSGNHRDTIVTQHCDYNTQSGDLYAPGQVEMELSTGSTAAGPAGKAHDPVHLETSKISFTQQGSLITTNQPVKFSVGSVSGTAVGMSYGTQANWLELKSDVALQMQPHGGSQPQLPVQLNAPRLRYERATGKIELWGPIVVRQGSRTLSGDHATVNLNAQNHVTHAVMDGAVKGSDSSPKRQLQASADRVEGDFDPANTQLREIIAQGNFDGESRSGGKLSSLSAQTLSTTFAGANAKPVDGTATGNARFQTRDLTARGAADPQAGTSDNRFSAAQEELTSGQLQFAFYPGGQNLKEVRTVGPGKVVFVPTDPKAGRRVITGDPLLLAFNAQGRLENLRAPTRPEVVFELPPQPPKGSVPQESTSDKLEALFDPASGDLRQVEQSGNFQFHDGDREATSDQAHYDPQTDYLILTGRPKFRDSTTRATAIHMRVNLHTGTAEGQGNVHSTHLGEPESGRKDTTDDPTNIIADRMVAEKQSEFIHYEGHVRAWHDQDVVETSSIDVYNSQRRMSSGARVNTSHIQVPSTDPSKQNSLSGSQPRPVNIQADHLDYFDEGRKSSYSGHVVMKTETTTLRSDHLDIFFTPSKQFQSSEVERSVATGHVVVAQPGRRATGERAEYFASTGKIILTGGPPTLNDSEKGFTTGQRLTFFTHNDRILVDGGNNSPALSKHRVPH